MEYSGKAIAGSEIFSAIDGTKKEITFTSDNVDWQFNGEQVESKSIKSVDLSTEVFNLKDDKDIKTELIKS